MELPKPGEFTDQFCDGLIRALDWCYERVGKLFRPSEGLDERWASLTIAMLAGRAYARELRGFGAIGVHPAGLVFEIVNGPHILRTNKLGRTSDQNVQASFPRPSRAAAAMASVNAHQIGLELPDTDQDIQPTFLVELPPPTRWIVGHMGTAKEGLQAVYLCAPLTSFDNAVTEWRGWIPIFRNDGAIGATSPVPGLPDDPSPLAIEIPLPPLDLIDAGVDDQGRDVG